MRGSRKSAFHRMSHAALDAFCRRSSNPANANNFGARVPAPNLLAGGRAADYAAVMDARTRRQQRLEEDHGDEASVLAEAIATKRDRLLAGLTLIAGIGVLVALPFALRAGAEFFMPVTAALVIAIALVPLLEWFERRGMPSKGPRGCA